MLPGLKKNTSVQPTWLQATEYIDLSDLFVQSCSYTTLKKKKKKTQENCILD